MPVNLLSAGGGTTTLTTESSASNFTVTIPASTGTMVGTDATQTLTNKTLTSPTFGGTPTGVGVLTSGTAVASTSGTSIGFTSIPSWAKRITISLQGVSTSGTSITQVQLGTGGTPTYTTTGYLGAASGLGSASGITVNPTTGYYVYFGGAQSASNIRHGSLIITNLSGNSWVAQGVFGLSDQGVTGYSAGSITLAAVLTAVRITTVNGTDTFDAGSINILYE